MRNRFLCAAHRFFSIGVLELPHVKRLVLLATQIVAAGSCELLRRAGGERREGRFWPVENNSRVTSARLREAKALAALGAGAGWVRSSCAVTAMGTGPAPWPEPQRLSASFSKGID